MGGLDQTCHRATAWESKKTTLTIEFLEFLKLRMALISSADAGNVAKTDLFAAAIECALGLLSALYQDAFHSLATQPQINSAYDTISVGSYIH